MFQNMVKVIAYCEAGNTCSLATVAVITTQYRQTAHILFSVSSLTVYCTHTGEYEWWYHNAYILFQSTFYTHLTNNLFNLIHIQVFQLKLLFQR